MYRHNRGARGAWLVVSLLLHGVTLGMAPAPGRGPRAPAEDRSERRHEAERALVQQGPEQDLRRARPATVDRRAEASERGRVVELVRVEVAPAKAPLAVRPHDKPPEAEISPPEPKEEPPRTELKEEPPKEKPPRRKPKEEPKKKQADLFVHFVPVARAPDSGVEDAPFISAFDSIATVNERPEITAATAGPSLDGMISRVSGTPSRVRSASRGPSSPGQGEDEPSPKQGEGEEVATEGPHKARTVPPSRTAPQAVPSVAVPAPVAEMPAPIAARALVAPVGSGAPSDPSGPGSERGPVLQVGDRSDRAQTSLSGASHPALAVTAGASPRRPPPAQALPEEPREQPERAPVAELAVQVEREREHPEPSARADADETTRLTSTSALKRSSQAAGHPTPSLPTEPFAPHYSPQAAFDDPRAVDSVRVQAMQTELGTWTATIDELIRTRWLQTDLSVDDVAFGLSGVVIVEFEIARNGHVTSVGVVRASGYAQLDAYAQLAIPSKLPRPPDGTTIHRIVFRYRNAAVGMIP